MAFGPSTTERGRDAVISSGRGGAGNMTRSPSRDAAAAREGQEHAAQVQYAKKQSIVHGGRGGVGNVRSPSRDPKDRVKMQAEEEKEATIQQQVLAKERANPHTTGRGGAGNVKRESSTERGADDRGRSSGGVGAAIRSLSRSRSREPRASSGQRTATTADAGSLAAVDETASSHSGSTHDTAKQDASGHEGGGGLASKIASHLPGHK